MSERYRDWKQAYDAAQNKANDLSFTVNSEE